jgi:hypothetical protein
MLINWGRRRQAQSEFAMPLMLEALLLLCFGLLGANLEQHRWLFVPATVALLCFVMCLQNAMITKISKFLPARMPVSAHHDQVSAEIRSVTQQRIAG